MYEAKRRGRDRCRMFDESMRRRVIERLVRENDLRHAVENGLLAVHYQPIVDLRDGRIRALEALARWPEGWGHVPPVEFIRIAEETGMISALGSHVLDRALADVATWRRDGLLANDVYVSVNVSSRQIEDPRFPDAIREAIRAHDLPTQVLRLEITESTLMEDPDRTRRIVSDICIDGIGLHLDDFGTGYSSLATLNQLPFDALKIDRSFVGWLATGDPSHEILVRSAVGLAHNLGMRVIVEGIETPEQLRRLQALGCAYGQGYLISRPLDRAGVRECSRPTRPKRAAARRTRRTGPRLISTLGGSVRDEHGEVPVRPRRPRRKAGGLEPAELIGERTRRVVAVIVDRGDDVGGVDRDDHVAEHEPATGR